MVIMTGMVSTVTDALNWFNNFGGFSYVIPFLLVFAVVFAILDKTKILGPNTSLMGIVGAAIGLLSLQFDFVPEFFAVIFPRFGVGLSIFLALLIFIGFFYPEDAEGNWSSRVKWIGFLIGIGVTIWALSSWDQWGYYSGFGGWFSEYIWALIVLGVLVFLVLWMMSKSDKTPPAKGPK
jgi:hypothetical protein